jgi:poly(3-hydroxybutyrate) depolymerase
MMYYFHEMQKSMMAPAVSLAGATKDLFTHPFSPFAHTPFARNVAANHEVFVRLMRRYEKPEFGITEVQVGDRAVAVSEEKIIEKPFCTLLHFKRDLTASAPRLLIVAPLSGHFATLLRDTVRTALQDFDVYVTDWADAKMVPIGKGPFHLETYVQYLIEFLQHLGEGTHTLAVCQPTVPVMAASSLMADAQDPCAPRSMVLMGGPVDARKSPTSVNAFAQGKAHSWFVNRVIMRVPPNYPGFMRKVYPGFLQHASFLAMNPDKHAQSHRDFYQHLVRGDGESADAHRKFYDEYNAVLDMAAEYYLDTIKMVFHEYQLPLGTMTMLGRTVRPEAISKTRLFTIEGELDDIAGIGQTEAAHVLCANIPESDRKHLLAQGVGHYGVFSGRRYREQIYPQIRDFIFAGG